MPDILLKHIFLGQIDNMFANRLILQLLWSVLHHMLFATYLELFSKLITVSYMIVGKKFFCGAMLDPKLGVGLHWLAEKCRSGTIRRQDAPDGIVVALGAQAHLLVSGEPRKDLWSQLARVQVERLVEDVWICHETHLISIANHSFSGWAFYRLNVHNTPSAWRNVVFVRGTGICLIN